MYAIELFFSAEVEEYVRRKWKELSINNITSSMYEIDEVRPHVTLAVYKDLEDLETYEKDFDEYFKNYHSIIELKFDIIGTFPTTGTVFLKPTITKELIDFHLAYHNAFQDYSQYTNQYYIPGNWDPHCTFAIGLKNDGITKTIDYILPDFKPVKGKIIEIGFVDIKHDGNKFVSSRTLFSKKLV